MSSTPVYVDETKSRDYLLVACAVPPHGRTALRRSLRGLVLPGQRRLHMNNERDPRKRAIADAVVAAGVRTVVYDAGRRHPSERDRRAACLRALVADPLWGRERLLVLEEDESLVRWDERCLRPAIRKAEGVVAYEHRRAAADQLLAIPDAVAWCWARGGDWRRRIRPAVDCVREV